MSLLTQRAELLYEAIGYRWAEDLRGYQAREPRRFVGYFKEQAHLAGKLLARTSDVIK